MKKIFVMLMCVMLLAAAAVGQTNYPYPPAPRSRVKLENHCPPPHQQERRSLLRTGN